MEIQAKRKAPCKLLTVHPFQLCCLLFAMPVYFLNYEIKFTFHLKKKKKHLQLSPHLLTSTCN